MNAAYAVRHGMSKSDALRAITINPAELIHADDRIGSIDEGKDADLVILSGNPLSVPKEELTDLEILLTMIGALWSIPL